MSKACFDGRLKIKVKVKVKCRMAMSLAWRVSPCVPWVIVVTCLAARGHNVYIHWTV